MSLMSFQKIVGSSKLLEKLRETINPDSSIINLSFQIFLKNQYKSKKVKSNKSLRSINYCRKLGWSYHFNLLRLKKKKSKEKLKT
jgi:hypothetical protein